ncbi:hypothetical protein PIB30_047802 [Stylosanthes scabra]|uniref:Retrotransposon gag domain-containing protein n=1 Tax=Stylosanthes scabra TaxID=79078 RepID=A0ABU6WH95_9FABA|nr:hypothetical protein [Stylosanthes scabra]
MVNRDEERVVYTNHSGDEQRRNPQHERQSEELDLNATANEAVGSGNTNTDSGGVQNRQPPPHNPNSGNRPSAFDRIGPGGPTSRPFGGIGSDKSHITQELRHRMQSMELEVRKLRKENAELRTTMRNLQSQGETTDPIPRRGGDAIIADQMITSPPRKKIVIGVEGPIGSTKGLKAGRSNLQDISLTDMKYDGSIDPHIHLNHFEHRMICDGAVDEVKCRAFPTNLIGLASQWFTSLPVGSISSYSEIRELFLNEFTTSIDNTKIPSTSWPLFKSLMKLVDDQAGLDSKGNASRRQRIHSS